MTATRAEADAALGLAQIVERLAAERADERVRGAGHGVLGVDRFEEEPDGAGLGAGLVALLLDDRRSASGS
jgi:hypothetical protein